MIFFFRTMSEVSFLLHVFIHATYALLLSSLLLRPIPVNAATRVHLNSPMTRFARLVRPYSRRSTASKTSASLSPGSAASTRHGARTETHRIHRPAGRP